MQAVSQQTQSQVYPVPFPSRFTAIPRRTNLAIRSVYWMSALHVVMVIQGVRNSYFVATGDRLVGLQYYEPVLHTRQCCCLSRVFRHCTQNAKGLVSTLLNYRRVWFSSIPPLL
ncbi:hypothetical protein PILCRDRAFT_824789, partial [Piloderma croceum F 1598]